MLWENASLPANLSWHKIQLWWTARRRAPFHPPPRCTSPDIMGRPFQHRTKYSPSNALCPWNGSRNNDGYEHITQLSDHAASSYIDQSTCQVRDSNHRSNSLSIGTLRIVSSRQLRHCCVNEEKDFASKNRITKDQLCTFWTLKIHVCLQTCPGSSRIADKNCIFLAILLYMF